MRSALALQFAKLVVTDELDQLDRLDGTNALELLDPPPVSYRGERAQAVADVAPGSWYYAREPAVIAYMPRYPLAFDDAGQRLYWRVIAQRDAGDQAGYDERATGDGVVLVRSTAAGRPLPRQDGQVQYNEQEAESQP